MALKLMVTVVMVLLSQALSPAVHAQEDESGRVPDPAECTAPSRPIEDFQPLIDAAQISQGAVGDSSNDAEDSDTDVFEPSQNIAGMEFADAPRADDETVEGITQTLDLLTACRNAGSPLQEASLYTDDFLLGLAASEQQPSPQQIDEALSTSGPLSQQDWVAVPPVEPEYVRTLPDGRIAAMLFLSVVDYPEDPPALEPVFVFVRGDVGWLIDEVGLVSFPNQ